MNAKRMMHRSGSFFWRNHVQNGLFCTAVLTSALVVNIQRTFADAPPELDGRWQLVALIQDGQPASDNDLKQAHVDIRTGKMVFHLTSRPTYPDLQVRFEFVPEGIDLKLTHGDIDRALKDNGDVIKATGAWELKDGRFRFALYDTDDAVGRPRVAPAKNVIYLELRRSSAKIQ